MPSQYHKDIDIDIDIERDIDINIDMHIGKDMVIDKDIDVNIDIDIDYARYESCRIPIDFQRISLIFVHSEGWGWNIGEPSRNHRGTDGVRLPPRNPPILRGYES